MAFRFAAHQAILGFYLLLVFVASAFAASGPTVTAMTPAPGSTLTTAPTSLTVTLSSAINLAGVHPNSVKLVRAGQDGTFDTSDDVMIVPASLTVVGGNQIKLDLTGLALPNDKYRVSLTNAGFNLSTNLYAYWPMDEGAGNNAADVSGNNRNLTLSNTSWTTGVVNGGLLFNGNNSVGQAGLADLAVPWSLSFYVNRLDTDNSGMNLMSKSGAGNRIGLEEYNNTKKVGFSKFGTADYTYNYSAPANTWTKLTYVAMSGSTSLYVNGTLLGNIADSISLPLYYVGDTSSSLNGSLDDMRVYNRALSASEIYGASNGISDTNGNALDGEFSNGTFPSGNGIAGGDFVAQFQIYNVPGLSIFYSLDEGSGTVANDSSGNTNNGTIIGAPSFAPDFLGRPNKFALQLNGTKQQVYTNAAFTNPQLFTLAIRFKTTSTTGGRLIGFANPQTGTSTDYDRILYLSDNGQVYFGIYPGQIFTIASANSYNDGAWHHAAATLSASGIQLYVDGVLANSSPTTNPLNYSGVWKVGADIVSAYTNHPTTDFLTGTLDDARVYSRVLSSAEILDLALAKPVIARDAYKVFGGQTLNVPAPGVLANDNDQYGLALTAVKDTDVSHGTLALNANGSFSYTPALGYKGLDAFTYHAMNTANRSSSMTTVALNVDYLTVTAISPNTGASGQFIQNLTVTGSGFSTAAVGTANFNGHGYTFISTQMDWNSAKAYCESLGGHLATISSAAENEFVRTLSNNSPIWIGLTDKAQEGTFVWVTGEPLTYTNWYQGEPNNHNDEDYVEFFVNGNGFWNDFTPEVPHGFVCEFEGSHDTITIKNGSVEVLALNTHANSDLQLSASFNLSGLPSGSYDVVVANPDTGITGVLSNGFQISGTFTTISASSVAAITYKSIAQNISLSANVSTSSGIVNEGNVVFQLKNGNVNVGNAVNSGTVTNNASGNVTYVVPAGIPAGTYTISATYNGTTNYPSSSDTSKSLTINQAPISVTAANNSRLYGAANPNFTGNLTGVQSGDGITATYTTTATPTTPVGTASIVPQFADPNNKLSNYIVTSTNGTLTINKATLTINGFSAFRTYGVANPVFSGALTGIQNNDNLLGSYNSAATESTPVGSYPIVPNVLDPDGKLANYTINATNGTLTINKAVLTITGATLSRPYGADNPTLTGNITGIQNSENISATYATAAIKTSLVGAYPIAPTPVDPNSALANYTLTTVNGTLNIDKATLVIKPDSVSRTFGANNPPLTGTITGIANNDNLTATYSTSAQSTSNAGDYPITAALIDPDSKLSNYSSTLLQGTLTIQKSTPNISWPTPTAIVAGLPLSNAQLNATATDAISNAALTGAFTYTPAAGTQFNAGLAQSLSVNFTPADLINYNAAIAQTTIDVAPAISPKITSPLSASSPRHVDFTYPITADGSLPMTFTADNLPAGLTFDGTSLIGAPTASGVFFITLTVSNFGGKDTKTLRLTVIQSENNAPQILSPPTAEPNPALAGTPILFSAHAKDPDADALEFSWNFGDGTNALGESVSKTFPAAGVYLVKLTVSDGQAGDSQNINVVVHDQPDIAFFKIEKATLAFSFTKKSKDSLTLTGQLPLPTNFDPAGKSVRTLIGLLDVESKLDARGKSSDKHFALKFKRGALNAGFTFALKNVDLFEKLEDLGFTNSSGLAQIDLPVVIVLDGSSHLAHKAVTYSVKIKKNIPQTATGK